LTEIAEVKGYKALGSKFTAKKIKRVSRISPADPFSDGSGEGDDNTQEDPSLF
jgi:topoisomerase-4 subunit A